MKIRAIAVDDEPPALQVIAQFCSRIAAQIELVATFTDPREALAYLKSSPVDLALLDIQMPYLTGIDLRRDIPQETLIIFTTAHAAFAVEAFDVGANDYLLKPFAFERFEKAIARTRDILESRTPSLNEQALILRADYQTHRVLLSEIICIEALDDYLKIHVEGRKNLVVRMTMKTISEKLPAAGFIRVHRSFIVPVARITSYGGKSLSLGTRTVPVGATYEKALLDRMSGMLNPRD